MKIAIVGNEDIAIVSPWR